MNDKKHILGLALIGSEEKRFRLLKLLNICFIIKHAKVYKICKAPKHTSAFFLVGWYICHIVIWCCWENIPWYGHLLPAKKLFLIETLFALSKTVFFSVASSSKLEKPDVSIIQQIKKIMCTGKENLISRISTMEKCEEKTKQWNHALDHNLIKLRIRNSSSAMHKKPESESYDSGIKWGKYCFREIWAYVNFNWFSFNALAS